MSYISINTEAKEELLYKIIEIIVDPPELYDDSGESSTASIEAEALANEKFFNFLEDTINYYLLDFSKNNSLLPYISRDIFTMIATLELKKCSNALHHWVQSNIRMSLSNDLQIKNLYMEALQAFCVIQDRKNPVIHFFWENLWRDGQQFYWKIAFIGMAKQNEKVAYSYLGQLFARFDKECLPILNFLKVEYGDSFMKFLNKSAKINDLTWAKKAIELMSGEANGNTISVN